jgi:hypothetical protein
MRDMQRRTWLGSVVALIVVRPWARVRALAQASVLTDRDVATLQATPGAGSPSRSSSAGCAITAKARIAAMATAPRR